MRKTIYEKTKHWFSVENESSAYFVAGIFVEIGDAYSPTSVAIKLLSLSRALRK